MCAEVCQRWIAFEEPLNTSVDMKSGSPAGIKRVGSKVSILWQVYKGGWLQIEWHLPVNICLDTGNCKCDWRLTHYLSLDVFLSIVEHVG